jgi:hypothetical protein
MAERLCDEETPRSHIHIPACPRLTRQLRPFQALGAGKSEPCRNVNAATAFSEEAH